MRPYLVLLALAVGLGQQAHGQSCTGLCLQQVSCPNGGVTTITGTIYAPNNVDPLPNVIVYIPNAPVDAFTPGVSCPVVGQPPSGSPLVGTTTATDGTFTLNNVPVGANIPLVVTSGRWRRQVIVPSTAACTNTAFSTRMPQNQIEGDIPKIAIATGSADSVECVLRKVGIANTEFTDPTGSGRINIYLGSFSHGASVDSATPSEDVLMNNQSVLNQYDVLMLPCEGGEHLRNSTQLANIISYANAGGRVYTSHYGYVWMFQNASFSGVANWKINQTTLPDGPATVDTSFSDGQTLAQWLQLIGASTTLGQIDISTIRRDLDGVASPTQSWLTYNDSAAGNPVMQFTFNAPVGATGQQCGRVLFNEYHVENPTGTTTGITFPNECSSGAMTPQEKLLEYSLFSLTSNGGQPTLTPTSQDFGAEAIGFASTPKTFTWQNNSTFAAYISSVTVTGDFVITSNSCTNVAAGAQCQIAVAFQPTAIGQRTGTLSITSSGQTLTASLTGTGAADLAPSSTSLNFGNVDVGTSATQTVLISNSAPGPVAVPAFTVTGDYSVTSNCGAILAARASCQIAITFKPTITGTRTGTLAASSSSPAYSALSTTLTGNGTDFSLTLNPTSGSIIAGYNTSTTVTASPSTGYSASITLRCTTTAPGSTCTPSLTSFIPTHPVAATVAITTVSKYTVVGYGGLGGNRLLSLLAVGSGAFLWMTRRRAGALLRCGMFVLFLAATAVLASGCSGQFPAMNSPYTSPGTYTYTLTGTDGTLTHTATYTLNVSAK